MTRIAIAGASDVARAGVASIVSSIGGFDLVGRAAAPDELADLVRSSTPDVVLIDTGPNDTDDIGRWLSALGDPLHSPGVVLLSDEPADEAFGRHRGWGSLPRRAGRDEPGAEQDDRPFAHGTVPRESEMLPFAHR